MTEKRLPDLKFHFLEGILFQFLLKHFSGHFSSRKFSNIFKDIIFLHFCTWPSEKLFDIFSLAFLVNFVPENTSQSLNLYFSRMAGGSTERLVQPSFPSNGIQAKVRSKKADVEARNELWKHIKKELIDPQAAGSVGIGGPDGDLAYTEIKTVGNPQNVRKHRQQQKMSSSTGKIGSGHTPRRRRRDRVERAVAQTDWEGDQSGMVGPLPGKN